MSLPKAMNCCTSSRFISSFSMMRVLLMNSATKRSASSVFPVIE